MPASAPEQSQHRALMEAGDVLCRTWQRRAKGVPEDYRAKPRSPLDSHCPPPQELHIVGGGSFGARAADKGEAVPRLYNVLEIQRDFSSVRVHTREQRKPDGNWQGWHDWPDPKNASGRVAYYDIDLNRSS